jgi:lipid II:glycine glycyltransferase (peptidoglycan interpeptide bridge formation enzyme)
MEGQYVYFHVLCEGLVISTELVIYGTENSYSFLGGTNRNYFQMRPNDFLKYEIIKWGHEKGLKRFILGGGYGTDDGIFRYKKSLAPNGIYNFYIGKKIFDEEKYNKLVNVRKHEANFDSNSGFFPVYRAVFEEPSEDINVNIEKSNEEEPARRV